MELDYRNRNSLWCSVLVETLARKGLAAAVVSPGSRSTPLTISFARHAGIEAIPALDERSGSFFALGLAKRSGRPVALVCTSGTAAANYFPAIIEARESGVPLIVLTADRPPEMRACASGQTIDQQKLYGSYVVFQHELAVPEPDDAKLRYLRQTVAHAVDRALGPDAGPVHLNCPFRDPLHPEPEAGLDRLRGRLEAPEFWNQVRPPLAVTTAPAEWPLPEVERGIVIAGPGLRPGDVPAAAEAARRLGWPVLADVLSPLRQFPADTPALICHYDAILRSGQAAARLRPDAVLVLGGLPTSKVLRGWLESHSGVPTLVLSERADNRDPLHASTIQVRGGIAQALPLLPVSARPGSAGFAALWAKAESAAARVFDSTLASESSLFEGKAAWLLGRNLPAGTPLFVANSMPVRDLEYTWGAGDRRIAVHFNRGANGIDGTLSTAVGVAHGAAPAVLLTGDLSLLHDTNGFLHGPRLRGSLTIVLINNDGGGIFEHLPIARFEPPFETYFATPQAVSFADLARAHGAAHERVADWNRFEAAIARLPASGMRILEVHTDRKADAAYRRRLGAAAADAVESALAGA